MAGHSHAKNVMHRKNAQNAKKAKHFTKIAKIISVAISSAGADPNLNPRLRDALRTARSYNIPKDNIERIFNKAKEKNNLEEIVYEGYFDGLAVLVETITDNRTRTFSEIRNIFSKNGGSLGESGSVAFMFDKKGFIELGFVEGAEHEAELENIILEILDFVDLENFEDNFIYTTIETFHKTLTDLEAVLEKNFKNIEVANSGFAYFPNHTVSLNDHEAFEKLKSALEDNDDVQEVWSNLE